MRKYQQKQIQELLKTLEESLFEIKQLFLKRNFPAVLQLLADSQEFVIQIGTYIENIEGEGTETVAVLEEYNELLYRTAVGFDGNTLGSDDSFVKKLKKLLFKIENSVNSELKPNKLEAIFFPYKASMWDAFESVWLAMRDDPQCDVYVIPIPYFDRLPGGSFGRVNYEGNEYPDYVPIVDFRSYDVEAHHPDVIFVHNPYDSENIITSVHPDYYNRRLRNFTDLLVYIPYFVSTGNVSEHLCVCAGTLYADIVFLQSEKIRDTYIRKFKDFERINNCKGQFGNPEAKFVVSGSPKFDKVINSKLDNFTIPDEWRRLIEKADGTFKKIVLYNTSVGSILQGNEQYLRKLRHVLNAFRGREDVVLWWRPHPLSIQTYESMRPGLLAEYEDIVTKYQSERFGIYDNSTDMNRAIVMSSCYYGDMSSLVSLYQCTGKPILLQMPFVNFLPGEHVLFFDDIFEHEDTFLISSRTYNALFKVDMKSLQVNFIGHFPEERLDGYNLYHSMIQCGNDIYFAPLGAKEMAVFNPYNNSFRKIEIPSPAISARYKEGHYKFNTITSFGKFVYLIGYCYPAILQYDLIGGGFRQFYNWIPEIERLRPSNKESDSTYFYNSISLGEELFAPSTVANAVVVFNMRTCVSTVYEVGRKGSAFSGICFDGKNYWLSPYNDGIIVCWDRQTGESKEYDTGIKGNVLTFIGTIFANGYVWMFPHEEGQVLCIDPQNECIKTVDAFREICSEQSDNYLDKVFSMIKEYHGRILSFAYRSADFIDYNLKTTTMRRYHLTADCLPDIDFATHYGDFQENGMYTLHDYLDDIASLNESKEALLQRAQARRQTVTNGNGTSGEVIYAQIKRQALEV